MNGEILELLRPSGIKKPEVLGAVRYDDAGELYVRLGIQDYVNGTQVDVEISRTAFTAQNLEKEIQKHNGIVPNAKSIWESLKRDFEQQLLKGQLEIRRAHTAWLEEE